MPHHNCWGCSPDNVFGLQIKSHWHAEIAVCEFQPQPHHSAGPAHILNGGILASIMDCHSVMTAVADAYRQQGRPIGSAPLIWYVTGALNITYRRPTPINEPVLLNASVIEKSVKKSLVLCTAVSQDKICVEAQVTAVRVPKAWHGFG